MTGGFVFQVFDLIYLDGFDLTQTPLKERKAVLKKLCGSSRTLIRYSEHMEGKGDEFYKHACEYGIEGIVSKLAESPYEKDTAEDTIRSAIEKGKGFGHFHHTAYNIACAYSLMNKPEQAIKWLQAAADDGFPCYPLFESDPYLNPLREDSRFVTLMIRLKEQWKYYKALS